MADPAGTTSMRRPTSGPNAGSARTLSCGAVAGLVSLALSVACSVSAQGPSGDAARLLEGAIDVHVHSFPDSVLRSMDALQVSQLAKTLKMRGLVLKNHYDQTAGLAYMVRQQVDDLEVFGGIDLNLTQGGMNPAAVDHMAKVSGGWGRFVWMSSSDSEHHVRTRGQNRPSVPLSRNGELLPIVKEVIGVIARHNLVLATGHASPDEGLLLVREGKRQHVNHMIVTHPLSPSVGMSLDQMRAAAKEGALLEICGLSMVSAGAAARVQEAATAIRAVGAESIVLSSDLGARNDPRPPEGFGAFLLALRAAGIPEPDIDVMAKRNPARLLDLP
ncbi:MAG: DUF6282 family protein [Vicinamibacterales bacterium]